jgi:hypothetical protein
VHVVDCPRDPICGYESGPVAHKPFRGKIDLLVRPGPKEREYAASWKNLPLRVLWNLLSIR